MKIDIQEIPHDQQRYETIGDYWWDTTDKGEQILHIRVSETNDVRYFLAVALHEMVESTICDQRGIREPDIMAFDKAFEAARPADDQDSEPGDHPDAPYGKEHRFAENLERLYAAEMGVNWAQYDADLCKIWHPEATK